MYAQIKMRDELIIKPLTAQEAGDARDALAKALYSGRWQGLAPAHRLQVLSQAYGMVCIQLPWLCWAQFTAAGLYDQSTYGTTTTCAGVFNWIVGAINAKLDMGKKGSGRFIAILDIYGFEQFQVNR